MSRDETDDSNEDFRATLQVPLEDFAEETEQRRTFKESDREPELIAGVVEAVPPTIGYRPSARPPVPVLRVFDDNQKSGENLRIRKSPFILGRTEGDWTIPLGAKMSGRHAEIRFNAERSSWFLKDLGSTNGTFVRVSSVVLRHGQALIIGGNRYLFDADHPESRAPLKPTVDMGRTISWGAGPADAGGTAPPALVGLANGAEGERIPLTAGEHWIGRDPQQCTIVLEDPMVDPRHARIFQDRRGRWTIENDDSLNGLWVRIEEISLGHGAYFQCGEQRFLFKIL